MTANYEIDFATKTIIFTNKSFVQRANKEGSKEQMEVMGLRADFPTFKFEKKFTKGISNQNKGLSYEDICGKEFHDYGNNPQPISQRISDRCCDACNKVVIATRFDRFYKGFDPYAD